MNTNEILSRMGATCKVGKRTRYDREGSIETWMGLVLDRISGDE